MALVASVASVAKADPVAPAVLVEPGAPVERAVRHAPLATITNRCRAAFGGPPPTLGNHPNELGRLEFKAPDSIS